MDFKNKYFKYKKKYIELKLQMGGIHKGPMQENECVKGKIDKTNNCNKPFNCIDDGKCLNKDGNTLLQHLKINENTLKDKTMMNNPFLELSEEGPQQEILGYLTYDEYDNLARTSTYMKDKIPYCKCTCAYKGNLIATATADKTECTGYCISHCKKPINERLQFAVKHWLFGGEYKIRIEKDYGHISTWNTSQVTNMAGLFQHAYGFNEDISNWDVSNVTDMSYMFTNANSFNQPLNNWNVSKVKNMSHMFYENAKFNQPLNKWIVSNVGNMNYMFFNSHFTQDISNWDVSNVRFKKDMFSFASSIEERNRPNFNN